MGQGCSSNREITIVQYQFSRQPQQYVFQTHTSQNDPTQRQIRYQPQNRQFQIVQQETPLDRFNRMFSQDILNNSSEDEQNQEQEFQGNNEYKSDDDDSDNDGLKFEQPIDNQHEQLQKLRFQLELLNKLLNDLKTRQQEDQSYDDKLEINISLYYKRKHAQPIDYPCQHAKCQTVVIMNSKGIVNCQNGCPSFKIKDAVFDISKNQIFSKFDVSKIGHFVYIQSCVEMAQILNDSIAKSKMNDKQRSEFCKNFTEVICLQFVKSKKQQ